MKPLKIVALFLVFSALLFSCKKEKELSQEQRERSVQPAANQIIENEHGGLRIFIRSGQAQVKSSVSVFTTKPLENYFIEADQLPRNSTTEIWFENTSPIFDIEVEGFTASPITGKTFKETGLTGAARITMTKGIVLYTFNIKR